MAELLTTLASELKIRFTEKEANINFSYEDTTVEVKNIFIKSLKAHLATKLKSMNVGDIVEYCFDYGVSKPMEEANDCLAEVFKNLPKLSEGEQYVFPKDTYLAFFFKSRINKQIILTPVMSNWISEIS